MADIVKETAPDNSNVYSVTALYKRYVTSKEPLLLSEDIRKLYRHYVNVEYAFGTSRECQNGDFLCRKTFLSCEFSPFWAAILVVVAVTIVSVYLICGGNRKGLCAMLGTILGVLIAGIFATIFGKITRVTGYNIEDIETMVYVAQNSKLQIGGVLFSGILIASLGAVMDVAVSISSTIEEIHNKKPELTSKELFKSGINVGKDMMGTMSNTLILAFTGGAVNTMILIYAYIMPYMQVVNMYSIGIEVIKGISGTLGIVLTVPLVSLISAKVYGK